MKLQKANSDYSLECVKLYDSKSLEDLKSIKPKWAYGKDVGKLLDYIQNPKNDEYTIFIVDTIELIENAELDEVNPDILFTGDLNNDYRIARILNRWENEYFVDPPCIGLSSIKKKKLAFTDGRHRTKLTYLLGHKQIPVAIDNLQIQEINKIIKITNI